MAKDKRAQKKLKKLIEQRIKETQLNSTQNIKQNIIPKDKNQPVKNKEHQNLEKEPNLREHTPHFKKIGIIYLILILIIIGTYFLNLKTPILNSLANKIFDLFQKS